jgi:hypothetical protein
MCTAFSPAVTGRGETASGRRTHYGRDLPVDKY